jgi:hypothetical protein
MHWTERAAPLGSGPFQSDAKWGQIVLFFYLRSQLDCVYCRLHVTPCVSHVLHCIGCLRAANEPASCVYYCALTAAEPFSASAQLKELNMLELVVSEFKTP